ncbi:MAG: UvrD-helicase domain-containing protein [Rhabdochlamydiaceae bacterium]|jgi:exodeoxyribonuclease V beta subunit
MEASLSNESCVRHIRQKYQAVIVDEFQDTDPVQWNIFEKLFLPSYVKAIYLVGDPKQSIYAFRKADIYTFLKASMQFTSHAHLDTNYRSEQGLIQALNSLFCKKSWIDLPAWGTTLPVLPMKAGKQGGGDLHFFIAEGNLGREKRWPSYQIEKDYLFPFIVQEIHKVYGTSSIAILVKDRFQAHRIHTFLQEWNFPSSIQRGESLGDSLALLALQELIEVLMSHDLSLMKNSLGSAHRLDHARAHRGKYIFSTGKIFNLRYAV